MVKKILRLSYKIHSPSYMEIFHNKKIIGSISWGVGDWDLREKGSHAVGYGIHEEFQKKGVMTRALKYFIKNTSHKSIHAVIRPDNIASQKVVLKCGFKLISTGYNYVYEYKRQNKTKKAA